MAILIDSSVWVALYLDFDSNHEKAKNLFQLLEGKRVYLPYCIIVEVASVLARKHSKKQADDFLEFVIENCDIYIFNDTIDEEIRSFLGLPDRISFTDSSIICIAKQRGLEVLSFDKQLLQILRRSA